MRLLILLLILCGCATTKVKRLTSANVHKTVNIDAYRGWIVIEELKPGRYVLRNRSLMHEVDLPEWFGRVYHAKDTIK